MEAAGYVLENRFISLCCESLRPQPCCHGSGLKNTDIGLKIVDDKAARRAVLSLFAADMIANSVLLCWCL